MYHSLGMDVGYAFTKLFNYLNYLIRRQYNIFNEFIKLYSSE